MCYIKNVGLCVVGQVYYSKIHNSSEPAHRELFNIQFNHYLHNSIVLYRFGWISMGNVCNRGRKSARKVLTPEEDENKKVKKREDSRNHWHSLHEQIVPIPPQQIPNVEAKEYNATLKEASYMEVDITDPLVNEQSCEKFNNYVTPNANVTQQQPWSVVQSPNRSC